MDRVRIGIDENGLGARLGPLIVTAVAARTNGKACSRLPRWLARQEHILGDSKRLVSHQDFRLGEAWARSVLGPGVDSPASILARIGLDTIEQSMRRCPTHVGPQCWETTNEQFTATAEVLREVTECLQELTSQGLEVCLIRSAWSCTRALNDALGEGRHRFIVDLHDMERLILGVHQTLESPVDAVCGKVGGIIDYPRFFGPLAGRLHTVIEQNKLRSVYEFARLGSVAFVQDADANDPLVMIASLIGKYVRELFMARIARRYTNGADVTEQPSGYHDPVTSRFVEATATLRKSRRVPKDCFERRKSQ